MSYGIDIAARLAICQSSFQQRSYCRSILMVELYSFDEIGQGYLRLGAHESRANRRDARPPQQ
jgi:hypothetical protein